MATLNTGQMAGNFEDVAALTGQKITVGSIVRLFDGTEYLTSLVDGGSAIPLADSVFANLIPTAGSINDLSQAYIFDTVAEYKSFTSAFPVGKRVYLADRDAYFNVISGTAGDNNLNVIASTEVSQSIDLGRTRLTARSLGVLKDGSDQSSTMLAIDTIITDCTIIFEEGTYVMAGVVWFARSGFTLEFTGNPVFKLLDGANTFAFRLSSCSNFDTKGRLIVDGNKTNNTSSGGSSGSAANGTFSFSGSSNDFHIDYIKCINAWTNGIAFDNCQNFTAETLIADDSERRGVTVNDCSDFIIDKIKAREALQNTSVYVLGCDAFDIGSIIASGARGGNAVLFETGNNNFNIGGIFTKDSFSGVKFENNSSYNVGMVNVNGTTDSAGLVINGGVDIIISAAITDGCADAGLAILSAEADVNRVKVGSLITNNNGSEGLIIQTSNNNFIQSVVIDSVQCDSNTESHVVIDGSGGTLPPISGHVKLGEYFGTNTAAGKYDIEARGLPSPAYGRVDVTQGLYSTNYSEPLALASNEPTPSVSSILQYNELTVTANTASTTVTRFDDWKGDNRSFKILIQDGNTVFANGSGFGRVIVQGGSVAAVFGEMWDATYVNGIWYMHKIS